LLIDLQNQEHFVASPRLLAFFSVLITGDKFDFPAENLLLSPGLSILIKAAYESQWIWQNCKKDAGEGQKDQLDTGVRGSNAAIHSGSCFGRIDRPCVIDYLAILHVGGFSKERASFAP
jgi:hypothetical protein